MGRAPQNRQFVTAALIATAVAAISAPAPAQSAPLTLLGYNVIPPAAWTARATTSSMRLAQFTAGSDAGSDAASSAEVVVYFFGAGQGGGIDANLDRWRDQFSSADSAPVNEKVTRDSSGAFPVTFAEYHGTYRRGIGMGSEDSARAGQALVAAIVETPKGTLFIQLFGPDAKVAAERERFAKFVTGIR